MKARALYDFEAEDEEEISFGAGEIITVTMTDQHTNDGWWKGKTKTSKEGFFPSTYVEKIPDNVAPRDSEDSQTQEDDQEPESMTLARDLEEAEFKRITFVMEGIRDVRGQDMAQLSQVIKAKMDRQVAEWNSRQDEGNWGFPTPIPTPTRSSAQVRPQGRDPTNHDFQGKKPDTWTVEDATNWLLHMSFTRYVELFEEHPIDGQFLLGLDHARLREMGAMSIGSRIKLLNAIQVLNEKEPLLQDELNNLPPAFSSESLSKSDHFSEDENDPKELAENQVRAIADFQSNKKEELAFKRGDIIVVVERNKSEWWWGEFKGKTGLFPRSHVEGPATGKKFVDDADFRVISSSAPASQSVVLSAIDAVSPQGVLSAKNRKVSAKDINLSLRQSKKTRGKILVAPVPDIQAQEISRPDYQGWLVKQGGSYKSWKRRWFVLKDYCLYYFKDPIDGNALGCITLPSYTVSPLTTKEFQKKFAFQLAHSGAARTYYFIADTESEMHLWMKAIAKAALGKQPTPTKALSAIEDTSVQSLAAKASQAPAQDPNALTSFPSLPSRGSHETSRSKNALQPFDEEQNDPSFDPPFAPPANGPVKPLEPLPLPPRPVADKPISPKTVEGMDSTAPLHQGMEAVSLGSLSAEVALKKLRPPILPKPKRES